MYIMHIAIAGCLKAPPVMYGLTADTGGHITYLLGLTDALSFHESVSRIDIITRKFDDVTLGESHNDAQEQLSPKAQIIRLPTQRTTYLSKEALWPELDVLCDNVLAYIQTQDALPDVIHAHGADGAYIALDIKKRLNIPCVFTAHSLGKAKQGNAMVDVQELHHARRCEAEQEMMISGDALIASSLDEAENQYALYHTYCPHKIHIIPPGSPVTTPDPPSVEALQTLQHSLRPFLRQPDKPIILAIARPVMRKNLHRLVELYGQSESLQDKANLVIFAGQRTDIAKADTEHRHVCTLMLEMIDRYNLYGNVAIPKEHDAVMVNAAYHYAWLTGGVFVNPAINEPFGLTLLEAAAYGVPVVATDSGGSHNIVAQCRHGLVAETETDAFADAIETLLTDSAQWMHYSDNGKANCQLFQWDRFVTNYVALLQRFTSGKTPLLKHPFTQVIATDIDNTITGDREAMARFAAWCHNQQNMLYVAATGRNFHAALEVLKQWGAPLPDVLISSVGAEIYYRQTGEIYRADDAWAASLDDGWEPDLIHDMMRQHFPKAQLQPKQQQRRHKISYDVSPDPRWVEHVQTCLRKHHIACTVVYSHEQYLDILPEDACKGKALRHVCLKRNIAWNQVIAAGDSGNDLLMLQMVCYAIIVGNHTHELHPLKQSAHAYFSNLCYADGVIDGMRYFARLSKETTV